MTRTSRGASPSPRAPQPAASATPPSSPATRSEDRRTCHVERNHTPTTSQSLPIDHRTVPWLDGGCIRCHYAVMHPPAEISLTTCAACHADVDAVRAAGIGEDLHPLHLGTACTTCHEADNHRIEAMSTAVELECATCHAVEHDVEVDHAWLDPLACNGCHQGAHREVQALLLGALPGGGRARPSAHFMDGLTCRPCHVAGEDGVPPTPAVAGSGDACAGCHRPEYATVLAWWDEGVWTRTDLVDRYVRSAERALGEGGDGPEALREARTRFGWVLEGGGWHNVPLAHRLLREALELTETAWRDAGRPAPSAPSLGRVPSRGVCSHCHYRLGELGVSEEMDGPFHREALGR